VTIAISLFLPRPSAADSADPSGLPPSAYGLFWGRIAPMVVLMALTIAAISVLRLWPKVLKDSVPTRRWVLAVPAAIAVPCLVFTDYAAMIDRGWVYTLLLVALAISIAVAEELTYRGLVLEVLRGGVSEPWSALLSTLIFALIHVFNVANLLVVLSAFMGGYLYYLTRRATGFIAFSILVHALFDLFTFSHRGVGDSAFNMFVYLLVLFVVVLALSRRISPQRPLAVPSVSVDGKGMPQG
jgi:CAAX protease family protein